MRGILILLSLLVAAPVAAQIQSRPTDPPVVTAVNESWYQLGEPIQSAGELYYRAGAIVFFNGNTMVRTGHYNAVPLYTDTTVEPFSIVLVPIGRGLMQQYERLRSGELAGTTGSRPPSFPVRATPGTRTTPTAPGAPTALPQPIGAIGAYTSSPVAAPAPAPQPAAPVAPRTAPSERDPDVVGTTGVTMTARRQTGPPIVSLRRPDSNDGIWVRFAGERWVSAGRAVTLTDAGFLRVGEYAGRPVFARRELKDEVIYLPTATGLL